jgi:hypothetical protein
MKIDFENIIKIKSNKKLNKFNIKKPLFLNNYLFHYLILVNNLEGLKLTTFSIYIENTDNLNGFHLAAKEDRYEILCYLIEEYPDYIYNVNSKEETFINYLQMKTLIKLIKKYKDIEWNDLIKKEQLIYILKNTTFNELNEFMKLHNFKIEDEYISYDILYNLNISEDDKIKIYENFSNDQLYRLIIHVINLNYEKIFNYLIERNVKIDVNGENSSPLKEAIINDYINNNNKYTKIIINKLKTIDSEFYNKTNKYLDNITHNILYLRLNEKHKHLKLNEENKNYDLDKEILKYSDSYTWNYLNIDKVSSFSLVKYLDYDIYSKIIINNKINIDLNSALKPVKFYHDDNYDKRWDELFNKLDKYYKEQNDINFDNYPFSNSTIFNSNFKDIKIFFIYLSEKYKNLYIPQLNSIIYYKNENMYEIPKYLNNYINQTRIDKKYKFIVIFLSLHYDTTLHANILIYDLSKMIIERFEPYGNSTSNYNFHTIMDQILEEELTWNTGFKYITPGEYMPNNAFQNISDENNKLYEKPGDLGGFCLAWCLWYLESKLRNETVDSNNLIVKLIDKINSSGLLFIEYIRNYSNNLYNKIFKYMREAGIEENKITNKNYTNEDYDKLMNYIENKQIKN